MMVPVVMALSSGRARLGGVLEEKAMGAVDDGGGNYSTTLLAGGSSPLLHLCAAVFIGFIKLGRVNSPPLKVALQV